MEDTDALAPSVIVPAEFLCLCGTQRDKAQRTEKVPKELTEKYALDENAAWAKQ